jgi:hypothetical protein
MPEPRWCPPHSVWSRLLGLISEIEATGCVPTDELERLADDFELRSTPEDNDLARAFRAIARADVIK